MRDLGTERRGGMGAQESRLTHSSRSVFLNEYNEKGNEQAWEKEVTHQFLTCLIYIFTYKIL